MTGILQKGMPTPGCAARIRPSQIGRFAPEGRGPVHGPSSIRSLLVRENGPPGAPGDIQVTRRPVLGHELRGVSTCIEVARQPVFDRESRGLSNDNEVTRQPVCVARSLRLTLTALIFAFATLTTSVAFADAPETDEALFAKGAAALQAGEYGAAIDTFESLADRGFLHPDASYDRGLAYLLRIRSKAEKPGDLGRAAAAFEETLRLRDNDVQADAALDLVRAEVTRRRARKGGATMDVRPTLDRVVANLFTDRAWTIASLVASLLLATGLLLRRVDRLDSPEKDDDTRPAASVVAPKTRAPAHPLHVTGSILVAVGLVAMLALVPIAWHARTLRETTRAGVIVATEAHLTDETGKAQGGDPLPEAAAVEVGERRAGIVHVRWGAIEGWLPATSVRVLP